MISKHERGEGKARFHIYVTSHAVSRAAEVFGTCTRGEVFDLWLKSESLSADVVAAVTQRRQRSNPTDAYRVTPCARLIFVGEVTTDGATTIVTALRMSPTQQSILYRPEVQEHLRSGGAAAEPSYEPVRNSVGTTHIRAAGSEAALCGYTPDVQLVRYCRACADVAEKLCASDEEVDQ